MPRAKTVPPAIEPTYGPLVPCCKAFGIGRSQAFAFVRAGKLRAWKLGGRTFVDLDSLRTLPERMAAEAANSSGGDA